MPASSPVSATDPLTAIRRSTAREPPSDDFDELIARLRATPGMTTGEVAEAVYGRSNQRTVKRVYRLLETGQLRSMRVGMTFIISGRSVADFLETLHGADC